MPLLSSLPRRDFLKLAGAAVVAGSADHALAAPHARVRILVASGDTVASSEPVAWAVKQLRRALSDRKVESDVVASEQEAAGSSYVIVVSGAAASPVKGFASPQRSLSGPESSRLAPGKVGSADAIWVSGTDTRGLVYGLLELADRVQYSSGNSLGLHIAAPLEETPLNAVRSVARSFCSEIDDKPWYYDKQFWRGYLDMVAASRFNRFNFAFGFGYDFPKGVIGDYFHFPYPYLVNVPGYNVRVTPALADGEMEKNMEAFKFIAAETAARGLEFQLGIWTHAYEWTDSPKSDHHIEGLNAQNHAAYCRDALAILLKEAPQITGITLRVHGESGVPEGSYPFWETLFEAISKCGRKVEIDMHAKGINQIMIDMGEKTGMPIKIGAKSWAEHQGLGYHQADIRELEIPRPERMESGIFAVSNGERRFTRYGYADLFQEGRKYNVLFRIWPGTQRHLVWGDPAMAAGYSRTAHFCGAAGLELCEPLTFKGREGSGLGGGRYAYTDKSLQDRSDWQKFEYYYRTFGRMLYNPDTAPEVWQRYLQAQFGPGAASAETAITNASRILPLITTAHLPSASNHNFWPELYKNMPITEGGGRSPYSDTPQPRLFGTVSPLDPQLFSSVVECADDMLAGKASPKYSPIEVSQWLEDMSTTAANSLAAARKQVSNPASATFRQWEEDILILIGIGRFFSGKLRSALLYEIYRKGGSAQAGQQAVAKFVEARDAWAAMANRAKGVYVSDVSYGSIPMRRGHWADRLPDIDKDLEALKSAVAAPPSAPNNEHATQALSLATGKPQRSASSWSHTPAEKFSPGKPLSLLLKPSGSNNVTSVDLLYRHVNQGERWVTLPMTKDGSSYTASIPGDYTQSVYPLQYYFVLHQKNSATYHPAFNASLSNQPYFDVWRRA